MARYSEHSLGYEALNSPPPSMELKSQLNGRETEEVKSWCPMMQLTLMHISKLPRGHSGIQMDPWTSSTWIKKWNSYHTPNEVTKDKLNRFKQERTYRHISLHKTAGRQQLFRNSCWSPRPNRRQRHHAFGPIANLPSGRQHKLNKVRHRSA